MKKDLLELLIHKELTGEISGNDQQLLADWVNASEDNKKEYDVLQTIWNATGIEETELIEFNMEAQLTTLMSKVEVENSVLERPKVVAMSPRRKSAFPWMKIAAGFILLLGAVMIIRTFGAHQPAALVESTAEGEVESIDMIDGSTILLNENANLSFFPHIKTERRLSLEGEAFFDVAKNKTKPFIVETPNALIRVLGTSFKVTSAKANETVVAVRHGKVQITPKNGGEAIILTKGQKVSLQNEFSTVQTFTDFSLKGFEGLLDFDDTRLSKVMQLLEQKFGKEIHWNSEILANCEVNGKFDGKSLNEIMTILQTVFNFEKIDYNSTHITMMGGTCK